jgi:methyltransferase (TIGR00027 family)
MQHRADFSAETVAAARALAARERDLLVRNPDYVAHEFLGLKYRLIGSIPGAPRLAAALWRWKIPGIYEYLNARTHHVDQVVADETKAGAEQLVILGAGYDSRAYRLRPLLGGLRVFEVDQPGTLERKLLTLRKRFGGIAPHVRHVAHDFRRGSAFGALADAGYDPGKRTLFVWEGVAYYLTHEEVDTLLADVRAHACAGSAIVFDYLYQSVLRGDPSLYGAQGARAFLERRGQPYRSGIERDRGTPFMAARGFEVASDLTPAQMQQRYLRRMDGVLSPGIFGGYGMMHARVSPAGSS